MKILKSDNFLMLVPMKNEFHQWEMNHEGLVEIIIPRKKLMDRVVRNFIDTPKLMRVHLDPHGSCVWKSIDGIRCIQEIGSILESEFGETVMPVYERLGTYISILRNNKFITLHRTGNER